MGELGSDGAARLRRVTIPADSGHRACSPTTAALPVGLEGLRVAAGEMAKKKSV
jgi:hypothetical protein